MVSPSPAKSKVRQHAVERPENLGELERLPHEAVALEVTA